ncbi:MAG TPA: ABC transporter substrate-binding protein [Armatimonadota bacterium]|jgi:NitT/TauT family transport system substrate-binding protein
MKRMILLVTVFASIVITSLAYAQGSGQLKKVRIGTGPGACLAPAFVAYEKGFFKQEGLDAELVPQDFDVQKDALATDKIDAALGLLDKWLKPLEQGLDAKFTGGLHHGCIQLLVPVNSPIKSAKDLKGKRIGVPVIGDGPTTWTSRVLVTQKLNPRRDVTWRAFPQAELPLMLQRGEVDAISLADPFGELAVQHGQARVLVNQAKDPAWKNQYCCLVLINGKLAKRDPQTAAAITRALLNAALWVRDNPEGAAKIEVEGNYVPSKNVELLAGLLKSYNYTPSVNGGYNAVLNSAKQCKTAGILDDATDPTRLAKAVFLRLPGIPKQFK